MATTAPAPATVHHDAAWTAVQARDASLAGHFVFGVTTTGIYCRPGCPSPRPRREHVLFFGTPQDAQQAGFRACRRCHPERLLGVLVEARRRSVPRRVERVGDVVARLRERLLAGELPAAEQGAWADAESRFEAPAKHHGRESQRLGQ